jgi:hypothetical protein
MSAPKAPDPVKTANAQAQMNKDTAIAQYGLNATNQVTPQGNLTYTEIGRWSDGTPRYQATQTLSPEQKKLYDQQTQLGTKMNDLAIGQTDRLSGVLSQPVDLSNEATESRLMELGRARLDPMIEQRKKATETELLNKGVRPGTEAYTRAMTAVDQQTNDAYNQLLLTGRGQSVQEALAERNQPINEISALMGGGQVSTPQFTNTPQPGVNGVDYTGLVNNKYKADMEAYSGKMSGLFGLAGAFAKPLGGWMFGA